MFEHLTQETNPKIETFCKLYEQFQKSLEWFKRQPEHKDVSEVKKRFYTLEIKLDQAWNGLTQQQRDDCLNILGNQKLMPEEVIRAMEIFRGHWIKYKGG